MSIYFRGNAAAVFRKGDNARTVDWQPWECIAFDDPAPDQAEIMGGLFFGLSTMQTTTATARAVLEAYGHRQPADLAATLRAAFWTVAEIKQDDGTVDRPFQPHDQREDNSALSVWGLVLALEAGLIHHQDGAFNPQWRPGARAVYDGKTAAPAAQMALF